MARRGSLNDPKTVVLVHPDGTEYSSNSPAEINRLHYGLGYTFRDVPGFTEALEHLGDEAATMARPSTSAFAVPLADDAVVTDEVPSE